MQSGVRTAKAFSRTLINNFQNSLPRFEAEIENIVQQNMNNLHQQISDEEYAATVSTSFNELAETGSQSFEGEEKKLARGITIRIFKDYLSNPRILSSFQPCDEASRIEIEESKQMNDQDQARLKDSIAVSIHKKSNESMEMEQEADESSFSICDLADNFKRLWGKVQCILTKKILGIGMLIGGTALLGARLGVQAGGAVAAGAVGGGLIGLAISVICCLASKFWFSSPDEKKIEFS